MNVLFLDYTIILVYILWKLGFWEISLLKDTLLWAFGAFVLMFKTHNQNANGIRKIALEAFKWTLILEFLVAFHSFSFLFEFFLLLPFFTILGTLQAYSETDEKYSKVGAFFKNVSSVIGLIILGIVIYKTLANLELIFTIANLKNFLLPIFLTISFVPFIYFLKIFMTYENLFARINVFVRNKSFRRKVKWQILKISNLNLFKLTNISRHLVKLNLLEEGEWKKDIKAISQATQWY